MQDKRSNYSEMSVILSYRLPTLCTYYHF